jgi:N-acetylglucosamine-6-sulfatase
MVLKTCKGRSCTHPWEVLHPKTNISSSSSKVHSLAQALQSKYDTFYAKQPKMWFQGCPLGYLADWESQEAVRAYGDDNSGQQEEIGARLELRTQGGEFDFTDHWHLLT